MNNVLRNILIVLAVLILAGGIFMGGNVFAMSNGFGSGWMTLAPGASAGVANYGNNGYGPGMMGGRSNDSYGPGMMGGAGNNGRNNYGPGMMGNYGNNANVTPLSVDQAEAAAESYIKTLGVDGLQVSEVLGLP